MNNLYNETYLERLLVSLKNELDDLEAWAVNNGDKKLDEIIQLKKQFDSVEQELI